MLNHSKYEAQKLFNEEISKKIHNLFKINLLSFFFVNNTSDMYVHILEESFSLGI